MRRRLVIAPCVAIGLLGGSLAAAPASPSAASALPCLRTLLERSRWGLADYEAAAWLVRGEGSEPGLACVEWPRLRQSGRAEWPAGRPLPRGLVAQVHTHATRAASGRKFGASPSWQDCLTARRLGLPVWVVTPQGVSECRPETTRVMELLDRRWWREPAPPAAVSAVAERAAPSPQGPAPQPAEPVASGTPTRPRRRPRTVLR